MKRAFIAAAVLLAGAFGILVGGAIGAELAEGSRYYDDYRGPR